MAATGRSDPAPAFRSAIAAILLDERFQHTEVLHEDNRRTPIIVKFFNESDPRRATSPGDGMLVLVNVCIDVAGAGTAVPRFRRTPRPGLAVPLLAGRRVEVRR
jgi:hypothetical protein